MGFWWGWRKVNGAEVYLQLEEDRLVARIWVDDEGEENPRLSRRELRECWSRRISSISATRFVRPRRFGSGSTMSVAVLDGDYLVRQPDGRVDLARTTDFLREVEDAVMEVIESATVTSDA